MDLAQKEFEDLMVDVPGVEGPVFGWLLVDLSFEKWRQASFVSARRVRGVDGAERWLEPGYQLQEGESLVLASMDHDHCELCQSTFFDAEYLLPVVPGWTGADGGFWLCDRCHAALMAWYEKNSIPAHWRPFGE